MKKFLTYISLSIISALFATQLAYAVNYQPPIIPRPETLPGPEITSLEDARNNEAQRIFGELILPRFAVGTIAIVGGISLVFIVIGGVRFVTAYGDEEAVENAKKEVRWAITGFLLALLSYTIVLIISNLEYVNNTTNEVTITAEDE